MKIFVIVFACLAAALFVVSKWMDLRQTNPDDYAALFVLILAIVCAVVAVIGAIAGYGYIVFGRLFTG